MSALQEARWRRPGVEKTWRYGKLVRVKDWATLVDSRTGGIYSIMTPFVQVKELGPRGGAKWVPLDESQPPT